MIELVIIVTIAIGYSTFDTRVEKDDITVLGRKKYETLEECERTARIINLLTPHESNADIKYAAYCEDPK